MPWQEFDRKSIPLLKRPYVTIQSKGTLGFNASSHAALGSPEAIVMMFDEEAKLIGFRAAPVEEPNAYPIRAVGEGKSFIVAGTAFLNFFKIPYGDHPTRYPAELREDVLVIDLEDGRATISNRTAGNGRSGEQLFDEGDENALTESPPEVASPMDRPEESRPV